MRGNGSKKKVQVASDLNEVQKAGAEVLTFLKPLALSESHLFDIRLCLEEALINAIKYGNRLRKEVPVNLTVDYDDRVIRLTVEDQGEGFKVQNIDDCTKEENLLKAGGRGVFLIHQLMDQVRYNAKGNSLLMVKSLKKNG